MVNPYRIKIKNYIKMKCSKSSENIQKKEGGQPISVSNNPLATISDP